jgi:hypothetical protein
MYKFPFGGKINPTDFFQLNFFTHKYSQGFQETPQFEGIKIKKRIEVSFDCSLAHCSAALSAQPLRSLLLSLT